MQILNLPNSGDDVFTQLRQRAACPERLAAARGRMLLQLVEHLQSQGPTPQVFAVLVINELWISIANPYRMVRVWVDWRDYGGTRDGLPVMHYRLQMSKGDMELSHGARATNPIEADRVILELFR